MLVAQRLGYDRTFLWSEKQQNYLVAIQPQVIEKLNDKFISVHGGKPDDGTLLIVYEFFTLWRKWSTQYSSKQNKGKEEGLLQAYRHGRRKDEGKFIKLYTRFCHLTMRIAPVLLEGHHSQRRVLSPHIEKKHDRHEYDMVMHGLQLTFGEHASITQCYSDARRVFYEGNELAVRPYLLAHLLRDLTDLFLGQFINLRKGKTLQSDFITLSLAKVVRILDQGDRVDVNEWIAFYKKCVMQTHLDVTQDGLAAPFEMDDTWHAFNRLFLQIVGDETRVRRLLQAILRYCGVASSDAAPSDPSAVNVLGHRSGFSQSQLHVFSNLLDFALLRDARFCSTLSQEILVSGELWKVIEKKFEHWDLNGNDLLFFSHLLLYSFKLLASKSEEARTLTRLRESLAALLLPQGETQLQVQNTSVIAEQSSPSVAKPVARKIYRTLDTDLLHEMIAVLIRFINTTVRGKDTRSLKQMVIKEISSTFGGIVTQASLTNMIAKEYKGKKLDPRTLERFLVASNIIDEYGIVRVNPMQAHGKQKLNMKKFKVEEAPLEAFLASVHLGSSSTCTRQLSVIERLVGLDATTAPTFSPMREVISAWMKEGGIGAAILAVLPERGEAKLKEDLLGLLIESVVRVCRLPSDVVPPLDAPDILMCEYESLVSRCRLLLTLFSELQQQQQHQGRDSDASFCWPEPATLAMHGLTQLLLTRDS